MTKLSSYPNSKANVATVESLITKYFNVLSWQIKKGRDDGCKNTGHTMPSFFQLLWRHRNSQRNPGAARHEIVKSSAVLVFASISESSNFSENI